MATLEFQVEVDSDVHPELYAALAAVARAGLRPERLRQLAASGLIWEHLRGRPRAEAPAVPAPDTAPRDPPPVLRDVVQLPAQAERRAAPRTVPEPVRDAPATPEPPIVTDEAPDFDLVGLDTPPAPAVSTEVPVDAAAARRARIMRMKASGLFNNG